MLAEGGAIRRKARVKAIRRSGALWRIATDRGDIAAETVIIGTNAYTGPFWPGLQKTFLPARTPRAIVDQVYQASQRVMNDPAMQTALIEQGLEPITNSSPDKVTAFMQEEVARWAPVVKAAGLKAG